MYKKDKEFILLRSDRCLAQLRRRIIKKSLVFDAEFSRTKDPVPFAEVGKLKFKKIGEGAQWGATWDSAWFRLEAVVPKDWKGEELVAQLDFSGEALIFSNDGLPVQSLTNGCVWDTNYAKDIHYISKSCKGGEKIKLLVETAANGLFGVSLLEDPDPQDPNRHGTYKGVVNKIKLCAFDREVWSLHLDLDILARLAKKLPENSVRRDRIIRTLDEAMDAFQDDSANAALCRKILAREFAKKASASDLSVLAVGHAHIDTGWLWPVRETIRKCARTFGSQITLLEKYPDYVFGASQAQHFAFTKEHYPKLYEKIRKYVKEGRWECQGGMWVEADCNIISGESMARQMLHGKNFFMDEFGVNVRNLWLPDVFGYSAALPQILRKSGIDYFVTQKICWNQYNEFPHNTFIWRGIDGSEVISHFPPENNYNSDLRPGFLISGRENFKEHDFIDSFLSLFGIGDGGGGPKDEHIEYGIRAADTEGLPKVKFGRAQDYLDGLKKYESKFETWSGELYLETHRGTLTTQARVKKGNRYLENTLRRLEFAYAMLPLSDYPAKELDSIWKILLINQFHDIIPGSSIGKVYDLTHQQYKECFDRCDSLLSAAVPRIFEKNKASLAVVNPLSCRYRGVAELPLGLDCGLTDSEGREIPVQSENGKTFALLDLDPTSVSVFWKTGKAPAAEKGASELVLENELVRYEFAKDATLTRIYDKEAEREILPKGEKGNLFSLYVDRPNNYDAWDIDQHYKNCKVAHASQLKSSSLPAGDVRSGLRFELKIGVSTICQEIHLSPTSKRLDFTSTVDWKERHKMLRVSFPVNVTSESASYDIQYSFIKRPTHTNTQWDHARFECVAHRYADLSESDYGVALINDCKYGHKIHDNVIDLNLLRSPAHPDPDADICRHEFKYCLLPHLGSHTESDVISEAAMLNVGLMLFDNCGKPKRSIPCAIRGEGVSLEVVKKAEKEDCLVLRLVETNGAYSKATLLFAAESSLIETDIMEWKNGAKSKPAMEFEVSLSPFEIRTYKLIHGRK